MPTVVARARGPAMAGEWGGQGCLLRQRLWARYARSWAIDGSWDADLLAVTSRVTTSIASLVLTCVLRQNTVFAESMHARLASHVGPLRPLASVGVHGVSGASGISYAHRAATKERIRGSRELAPTHLLYPLLLNISWFRVFALCEPSRQVWAIWAHTTHTRYTQRTCGLPHTEIRELSESEYRETNGDEKSRACFLRVVWPSKARCAPAATR